VAGDVLRRGAVARLDGAGGHGDTEGDHAGEQHNKPHRPRSACSSARTLRSSYALSFTSQALGRYQENCRK
jgi:hypothetical protein